MRNCSHIVRAIVLALAFANVASAQQDKQEATRVETRVETVILPSPVQYETTRQVPAGRIKLGQEGTAGQVVRTFEVTIENGKVTAKKQIKEDRTEPTPTIYYVGNAGHSWQPSRGSFVRGKVLDMVATAYTSNPGENGGWSTTRTGMQIQTGLAAVDPRVIPLGTLLFVEGYGFALACDTGSAIKGNRIDLVFPSSGAANNFGRRAVKVHILKKR